MSGGTVTVFHASDFQIGSPFLPEAADALVRLLEDVSPDLVVVSGDLTQRAKRSEFRAARALLDRFGSLPVVLTPGNHDVPVYRLFERCLSPFKKWREFTGARELDSTLSLPGITVVALASAAPYRAIVSGRIDPAQLDFARRAFEAAPVSDIRLIVTHHHFVAAPEGEGGRVVPGGAEIVEAFSAMGVDAVLGGHVHQLHFKSAQDVEGAAGSVRPIPLLSTGTATSRRGRGAEGEANSVCVHQFGRDEVVVAPYIRSFGEVDFRARPKESFRLGRPSRGVPTKNAQRTAGDEVE